MAKDTSLSGTTEWLRDFFETEANVSNTNWRDKYRIVAKGCEITIVHDTEDLSCTRIENKDVCDPWPHSTMTSFRQVFNLKDIDMDRIEVHEEASFRAFAVSLTTQNNRPLVAHAVKIAGEFVKSGERPQAAYAVLPTQEGAERVAKAFRNAVARCGGKRSAF
ncbi:MAG: hypothetical protein K1Y01_21885 [Vicinamibacteria bacterium]|nr:hypothetical protein [Vicinamibacteria bacterium]